MELPWSWPPGPFSFDSDWSRNLGKKINLAIKFLPTLRAPETSCQKSQSLNDSAMMLDALLVDPSDPHSYLHFAVIALPHRSRVDRPEN